MVRDRSRSQKSQLLLSALATSAGALLLAIVLSALSAEQRSNQRWAALKARGVLRAGIDPNVVPFSFFTHDGSWAGYDADVAQLIARQLELTLQPVMVGYDSLYDALLAERVDMSISAITPEGRGAEFAYSAPYFDKGPRLLGVRGVTELENKTLAVALGGEADQLARYLERRLAGLQLRWFASDEQVVRAWQAGKAQAALLPAEAALALGCPAVNLSDAAPCSSPRPVPIAIVLRSSDQRLQREIDRAIQAMQQQGTLDRLAQRWFTQRVSPSP